MRNHPNTTALIQAAIEEPIYFPSGSSHPGEIAAFAAHDMNVGVALDQICSNGPTSKAARKVLKGLRGRPTKVFIDTGAFGEVEMNAIHKCGRGKDCKAGTCIGAGALPYPNEAPFSWPTKIDADGKSKFIDHARWTKLLDVAEELAEALAEQAIIVAPDRVGDQVVTLERLARYADRVVRMRDVHGARIIVPIQKGDLSQIDFDRKVRAIIGEDFIRGIPSKKAATTVEEIRAFCSELKDEAPGAVIHLLGLGPKADDFAEKVAAVQDSGFECWCDSVMITSIVGSKNGRGNGPRDLTWLSWKCIAKAKAEGRNPSVAELKFEALDRYLLGERRPLNS